MFRELQDRTCENAVGKSKFIQNREVVCLYDRNQLAGEMSLSPVCVEIRPLTIIAGNSPVP